MRNGRRSITLSLYDEHIEWLRKVGDPAQQNPSEVVRALIESFYDARFTRTFFGWQLRRPAWREEKQ